MEEKQTLQRKTDLIQKSGTYNYKLVIPIEVEKKIRFACQKVWDTEWSGILFFTHEGSFEDDNLIIRCVDIYIMDIGIQTYTEFDMNPDVIAYMTEHSELLDCQVGLIHSHNNMPTFFSNTDTATLKEEGMARNNFVSLIVNNAGTYTAAITRKVRRYSQIKDMLVYEFFGDGEKQDTKEYTQDGVDEIEYFYLKINKEGENYSFSDIDVRLEEIKQQKKAKLVAPTYTDGYFNVIPSQSTKAGPANINSSNIRQKILYNNIKECELPFEKLHTNIPHEHISVNQNIIKSLIRQLITCSIIITNDSKMDIYKWARNMPTLYEKRFGKGDTGIKKFKEWADQYVEYLTWNIEDEDLINEGFDQNDIQSIYANELIDTLTTLPENNYIKIYIDELEKYLTL